MSTSSSQRAAVAALGGACLLVATLAPLGAAYSAPLVQDPCPTAKPITRLASGQPGTSLTVSKGTTPDRLTGEVVGVLDDGIAPGIDMVIVTLAGSRVTNPDGSVDAGIWAGMSGSPVYAADGRLIGAVSYGLSLSPSDYAGVTPAAHMYDVLGAGGTGARSVDVPARIEGALRADGVPRAGRERFRRLPMPMSVSGSLGQPRLDRLAERAGVNRPLVAHGGRAGAAEPAGAMVVGGNLAASLSYGDITAAGIGTVTAVCGRRVVGFGHPMLWSGPSDLTMHGADALFVQRDDVFGSFKVANPTAPVGAVLQDRLAAIVGVLGHAPAATSVTSRMSSTEGAARRGTTAVSHTAELPFLAAIHVLSNADVVFNGIRAGTGHLDWTITVTLADGSTTRIRRGDLVADRRDLTYSLLWGIYRDLSVVVGNRFEDVQVTDVDVTARLDTRLLESQIAKVEARRDGRWIVLDKGQRVKVRAGGTLPLRVRVLPTADSDARAETVRIAAFVPRRGNATSGHVHLGGGESGKQKVTSFDELVASLESQPPNNSVSGFFHFTEGGGGGGATQIDAAETSSSVRGGFLINVRVLR